MAMNMLSVSSSDQFSVQLPFSLNYFIIVAMYCVEH